MPGIRIQTVLPSALTERLCQYETSSRELESIFAFITSSSFSRNKQGLTWKLLREISSLYQRELILRVSIPNITRDYFDAANGPSQGLIIRKATVLALVKHYLRIDAGVSYTLDNLHADLNTITKTYRLLGFVGENKIVIKTVIIDHEPYFMFNNFPIFKHPRNVESDHFSRAHFAIHNSRIVVRSSSNFISDVNIPIRRPNISHTTITNRTRPENELDFFDRELTEQDFSDHLWLGRSHFFPVRDLEGNMVITNRLGNCDCESCRRNRYYRFFGSYSSRGFRYAQLAREKTQNYELTFMYGPVAKPQMITLIDKPVFFNAACKLHDLIPKILQESA